MQILSLEQLLQIHALVIQATDGSGGLRDLGRLESAIATQTQSVFGDDLYLQIVDKAAAMIRGIIGDHPFVDGNKRTAILAGLTLLELNGIKVAIDVGEIEDLAVKIAVDRLDVPYISDWFYAHVVS